MAESCAVGFVLRGGDGVTVVQGWIVIGLLALIAGLIGDLPKEKR